MILDGLVTLALSPVLLFQAVQLRRRALRLPEADGPRDGIAGDGPVLRILIIGDSSAAGVAQIDARRGEAIKRKIEVIRAVAADRQVRRGKLEKVAAIDWA